MTYEWKCTICDTHVEITRPIADCRVPPEGSETCACEGGPTWARVYVAAGLTKASYVDGQRRFGAFREAMSLQKEANTTGDKGRRKEIEGEIRKMGVRIKKDGL